MTHFEFLTVAFSIIVAFAVTRLLEGLVNEIRSNGRYWVHVCWLLQSLVSLLSMWWAIWAFKEWTWNYGVFLWTLLGPALLFARAVVLVPRESETLDSWHAHYFANSRFLFILVAIGSAHSLTVGLVLSDILPSLAWFLVPLNVLLALVAAFTAAEWFHRAFALFAIVMATLILIPALGGV